MNNQNNCQNLREEITALVLGLLEPKAAEEIKEHIETCQNCNRLYQAMLNEEKNIRSVFNTISERAEVLSSGLIEEVEKNEPVTSEVQSSSAKTKTIIWQKIIRHPLRKIAAAAVIIIAIALLSQNGSINLTNVAWADIQKAILARKWLHQKYDSGTEIWYNLENGDEYYKNSEGRCTAVNYSLNIRHSYWPDLGEHITLNRPAEYKDDIVPVWEPKTALEIFVVGDLDNIPEKTRAGPVEVIKSVEHVDGKNLIRFDQYYYDVEGSRLLMKQLWIDPETLLPMKVLERLRWAESEEQNREYETAQFFYPESGPNDIYDLGVSRDLPIVNQIERAANPEVAKVVEATNAARENFPKQYRAVIWPNVTDTGTYVVWRNGDDICKNYYLGSPGDKYTVEEVLQWTQARKPHQVQLHAEQKSYDYYRQNPYNSGESALPEPIVRYLGENPNRRMLSHEPYSKHWPFAEHGAWLFEIIEDVPEELNHCIGLRRDIGDIKYEYYVDPTHDYICEKYINWELHNGNWQKQWEDELSDFTQLPDGQFYASKHVTTLYDSESGTEERSIIKYIDVKLLDEDEFPSDIFNGEKLLESAKIEEW